MKTPITTVFRQLLILLICVLLLSCGGGGGGESVQVTTNSKYASIQISLGSTSRAAAGSTQLPDDITRCTVTCSGPGMTDISAELPLDGSPLIMSDIPPGVNRIVTINAYNNQLLRMSGAKTIPRLTAGTRTSVTIRVVDVAVMIISLNPIVDMATAVDSTFVQTTPAATLQLYSGVTNHVDDSVIWHVNGIVGGTAVTGTISSTGLYHAPATTGSFTVQTVSNEDSTLTDSITVAVVSTPANIPPTANAGTDRTVLAGVNVTLDGTGSTDSDGTVSGYQWTQTLGTNITLNNANIAAPLFIAPNVTSADTLTFELTVTDDDGATNSDTVSIIVQPAGTDFHVSPKIVHLLESSNQNFVSSNPSNWWEVEGIEGGDNTYGTISTTGYYNAPGTIPSNPLDVTIGAIETANTNNTDTARVAVVQDTVWQRTFSRSGYELADDNIAVSLGRIVGPYPSLSNITGVVKDSSGTNYLFFDEVGDSKAISSVYTNSFYQLGVAAGNWEDSFYSLRTSPHGYDDEFLIAGETSLPSGILDEAIGLIRANRLGQIQWAYQYETGPVTITYPCINSRYPFEGAMENTPGNGFVLGFSYYYNDECTIDQNHFRQNLFFYVLDQDGALIRNIRIRPAYQPGTDRYTAEMYAIGIHSTSDGGYLAAVNVNVRDRNYISHMRSAPVLIKLNSSFQLAWIQQFSEVLNLRNFDIGPSNSFYLTTNTDIIQINESGIVQNQQHVSSVTGAGSLDQIFYDSVDAALYISSSWRENSYWHQALIKSDTNFTIDWQHAYSADSYISSGYVREGFAQDGSGPRTIFLSGSHENRNGDNEVTILRLPADTGQLDNVTENSPTFPDMTLTPVSNPVTTFDITAGTSYDDDPVGAVEVHQLNPIAIAISPAIDTHTRSGQLLTIAIAQQQNVNQIYNEGDQVQFYATVSHLLADTSVTWSVNGIDSGNSTVGTIDTTGLYTSPDTLPSPATVIIRATSVEEPSLSADTNLTIEDAAAGGG